METMQLHRGRLIDHIHLVVRDLPASKRFYQAVLGALKLPMGGEGDDYFWADELFVSSAESESAQGHLTGRHHLAFQAQDDGELLLPFSKLILQQLHPDRLRADRAFRPRFVPLSAFLTGNPFAPNRGAV